MKINKFLAKLLIVITPVLLVSYGMLLAKTAIANYLVDSFVFFK